MCFWGKKRNIHRAVLAGLAISSLLFCSCTFTQPNITPSYNGTETYKTEPEPPDFTTAQTTGITGQTTNPRTEPTQAEQTTEQSVSSAFTEITADTTREPFASTAQTVKTEPTAPATTPATTAATTSPGPRPAVNGAIEEAVFGLEVCSNERALVDCSNKANGFLMIKYLAGGSSRVKVIITGPNGAIYTYDLNNSGSFEAFPLTDGSGTYSVKVLKNTTENLTRRNLVRAFRSRLAARLRRICAQTSIFYTQKTVKPQRSPII